MAVRLIEKQNDGAANKLIFLLRVGAYSSSNDPLAFAFRIPYLIKKYSQMLYLVNNLTPMTFASVAGLETT